MYKKATQELINLILTPYGIVLASFLASALAWVVPDFLGFYKGYTEVETVGAVSIIFMYCWYAMVVIISFFSFKIGKKLPLIRQFNQHASVDRPYIYQIYATIALLGFGYTLYVTLKVLGLTGFIYSVATFTTNRISEAIYEDYQAGIFSLRYVLIISFGWALYRVLGLRKFTLFDFLTIVTFIFYIAFFGRRLQLVCSLLIFLTLANRYNNLLDQLNIKKLFWISVFGFVMLSTATLLRNYGSYDKMGYSNPLAAVVANILSYLAAPFQVSLGIGNHLQDAFARKDYRLYTDVDTTLTANSAYAEMVTNYGLAAIGRMVAYATVFSMLAGWLHKNKKNYLYTGYPVILYAFAEIWRIELFNKGIFFTLLIIALLIPIIYALLFFFLPTRKKTKPMAYGQ